MLLSTNTEVSIAPKSRHQVNAKKGSKKASSESQKKARAEENVSGMSPKFRSFVLRVLPRQLVIFPEPEVPSEPTVYVSPATLGQIINSPLPAPPESGSAYYARVRRLNPPSTVGISSTNDMANAVAPPLVPQDRILKPKDPKDSVPLVTVPEGPKLDERVLFRCVYGIPERHIVRGMSLGGLYSDWDLVSYVSCGSSHRCLTSLH